MKVLDERLDNNPTANDVKELAELRIQNLLCFKELQSLNDIGKFCNEHPYLKNKLDYEELLTLWSTDREKFISSYENCKNNIRRYNGRYNRKTATEAEKEDALQKKQRHIQREAIFKKILANDNR